MPQIPISDNVRGLQETLELALHIGERTEGINHELYRRRIQSILNELNVLRPRGFDGKHGDLHTRHCGCKDKPHGDWCPRAMVCSADAPDKISFVFMCDHVVDKKDGHGARDSAI